ncbi:MAG: dihydropteroate synthase [Deltaproteobacteria bacterium]|nr:dihydropteroate synthase [Deltaproteobacteria bacterium]MBW1871207.1 dihydropteroate synthase [Deltaproteobacteria bacterium]
MTMRFGERPYIMGILNVTPDSFSDGGDFFEGGRAVEHALEMVEAGADLLDIGGESTRPGSEPVAAEDEIARVVPVIEQVAKYATVPISIDTTKARVAEAAIAAGAALVNDVSALRFDPEMGKLVATAAVPLVVMHMKGEPKTMQAKPIVYSDLMSEIRSFLEEVLVTAERAGIARERIIIDPGIGFGKQPEHNLTILKRLSELAVMDRPILVGVSRKAFIGQVLGVEAKERIFGTAAAVAAAVMAGAQIIRVHDVAQLSQVARMSWAINTQKLPN